MCISHIQVTSIRIFNRYASTNSLWMQRNTILTVSPCNGTASYRVREPHFLRRTPSSRIVRSLCAYYTRRYWDWDQMTLSYSILSRRHSCQRFIQICTIEPWQDQAWIRFLWSVYPVIICIQHPILCLSIRQKTKVVETFLKVYSIFPKRDLQVSPTRRKQLMYCVLWGSPKISFHSTLIF